MHSEWTPSRRVYRYLCSIFSGLRTALPWDYFYMVYPYSHPSTPAFHMFKPIFPLNVVHAALKPLKRVLDFPRFSV